MSLAGSLKALINMDTWGSASWSATSLESIGYSAFFEYIECWPRQRPPPIRLVRGELCFSSSSRSSVWYGALSGPPASLASSMIGTLPRAEKELGQAFTFYWQLWLVLARYSLEVPAPV